MPKGSSGCRARRDEDRIAKWTRWGRPENMILFPLTIDPRNPPLPVYVSKAIKAIEEVLSDEDN